jgi:PAS domain S-box-containing protein
MKLKGLFTSSFFLKSVSALSFFILIFISAISYKHTTTLTKSKDALMHSYNVRNELEVLMSHLKDAENGERGFIISNDSSFLKPYFGARKNIDRSLYILKKLAANNILQQRNIDTLYGMISLRFSYLGKALILKNQLPTADTFIAHNMLREQQVMDQIRSHSNNMVSLEQKDLKEKKDRLASEISFTPLFTLLLLLFSLFVFFIAYVKLNNNIEVVTRSNAQLLIQAESIVQAEHIGQFSTWYWDLDTNEITYSENQKKMLGISDSQEKLTMAKYIGFVHPDDRDILVEWTAKVKTTKNPATAFYRIIHKDGGILYFNSIGRILSDKKGKQLLIGINTDISEQHKRSLALEERNRELEQTNSELASFNYVASHDLQEPLRIIQIFISRINEKEKNTLTQTGKDYFHRIQASANRMQILINDLLLFSRTNKVEKVFECTDLNELLLNAQMTLATIIEEKKATVHREGLPRLKVIPFQIEQLFINLLSNSLKYTRPGVPPVVQISCQTIAAKDIPHINADPQKTFVKISFTDNGLGFEQQFAENIFILFKRLHQKNEYPGTGIGLSICKKIADNHSGYINALGKPGEGAIFSLFLPV